ncbi:MAG TPA: DUF2806 domain-containing protein, partial [Candidatus Kapabacteria bacterium]|nr:DUF2806 domain-containing protein [Candidatus Kapabacteria bacterium]
DADGFRYADYDISYIEFLTLQSLGILTPNSTVLYQVKHKSAGRVPVLRTDNIVIISQSKSTFNLRDIPVYALTNVALELLKLTKYDTPISYIKHLASYIKDEHHTLSYAYIEKIYKDRIDISESEIELS